MLWVIYLKKDYKNLLLIVLFVLTLGITINVFAAETECTKVFTDEFITALRKYVYKPIQWATPVILLVLTSFDFAQVVFGGKKENMDKAKNNFLKRALAAVIIFFAPNIIDFLVTFVNDRSIAACSSKF